MADNNSSLSLHPNPSPLMLDQDTSFQHGTSQSYAFNDSASQDHNSRNLTLETPESFAPSRNLYYYLDPAVTGQSSGSNGYSYEMMSQMAGDTVRRVSHSDPIFPNSMSSRYINQMYNGNLYISHGNGVNGQGNYYDDHYRCMMDPSRPILCSSLQAYQHYGSSLLEGIRGKVVSMAKEKHGSSFLQLKIDEGITEVIKIILSEVQDHMHELMTHYFGNYLIQKIFESRSVTEDQKNFIADSIIQDVHMLRDVCMNYHGTWVIQRMLENIKTPELMVEVTNIIRQITVPLMKNVNGGYVIQQYVKIFPPQHQKEILSVVAWGCVDIAKDESGCSFITKCMHHAKREAIVPLVDAIICNAKVLAEDPIGMYVVKCLVKMKMLQVNENIISQIRGKYVQLSKDKHACHVVQHLLKYSEETYAKTIILELMNSPELLSVLQDRYGNYVAQTALETSKGYDLHKSLLDIILAKHSDLCSHRYGKWVLATTKQLLGLSCNIR